MTKRPDTPGEFELIRRHFHGATGPRDDVILGIGDDCALLGCRPGQSLAVSMDTLVAGRHFLPNDPAEAVGHKALAVNLSDLAAMGAEPAWATLALTLPESDDAWVAGFMTGFSRLAAEHGVQLVGGDTTAGPLSITCQVHGWVDPQAALRRSGARAGDRLFVSGTLGDAALALRHRLAGDAPCGLEGRLDRPEPRVALGRLLAGYATAAIDISDGLLADLRHVCDASGSGARIELARLPLSPAVIAECGGADWRLPLAGGDDYELLFAVPAERVDELVGECSKAGNAIHPIGEFTASPGVTLVYPDGRETQEGPDGFDHFR
jgi:thiamine-monophosphate kinase